MTLQFHPVADIFPLLDGADYEDLKADIATNGLLEPIWLHPDGRILDGRNRYRACCDLGIEPTYRTYSGDLDTSALISFVVSLNLKRRHLNSSQRAFIALEVERKLAEAARERQLAAGAAGVAGAEFGALGGRGKKTPLVKNLTKGVSEHDYNDGKAAEQAAQILGTNRQYVNDAKRIQEHAPDLAQAVRAGEMNIPEAKRLLDERLREPEPKPERTQDEPVVKKVTSPAWYQSSESDDWWTPQWLFDLLDEEIGFETDVCASEANHKCARYFTKEQDGLAQEWTGKCWMNPPYGRTGGVSIYDWIEKAYWSAMQGATVACLIPARTDTRWWWDFCIHGEIRFLKGRIKFANSNSTTPFPSAVVIFWPYVPTSQAKVVWWDTNGATEVCDE